MPLIYLLASLIILSILFGSVNDNNKETTTDESNNENSSGNKIRTILLLLILSCILAGIIYVIYITEELALKIILIILLVPLIPAVLFLFLLIIAFDWANNTTIRIVNEEEDLGEGDLVDIDDPIDDDIDDNIDDDIDDEIDDEIEGFNNGDILHRDLLLQHDRMKDIHKQNMNAGSLCKYDKSCLSNRCIPDIAGINRCDV